MECSSEGNDAETGVRRCFQFGAVTLNGPSHLTLVGELLQSVTFCCLHTYFSLRFGKESFKAAASLV